MLVADSPSDKLMKSNKKVIVYDANIKLPTIDELKAMRETMKSSHHNKDFKGIYYDYIKLRNERFDYLMGDKVECQGDKRLMERLRDVVQANIDNVKLTMECIIKYKVYVSTEIFYETYKKGEVRDRLKKENGRDASCAICLTDIEMGEVLLRLKCDHYFHCECIETVALYRNKCPLCRNTAFLN